MSANSELQNILAAAFLPYESHQRKVEALDAMLHSLTAVADILKAERNAVAPIHNLPNEIIAYIFRNATYPGPSPNTSLLLVCQRWKDIAVHSPELYSTIEFPWAFRSICFFEQLKRSGDAPLRVHIGRLEDTEVMDTLMANAHRLAKLQIGGTVEYLLALVQKLVEHSFPLLYDLRLEVTRMREDEHDNGDMTSIPLLPSAVLDGRIPNLRRLELVAIEPPWTAVQSLRYLTIDSKNAPLTHPLEFHGLLALLSACPELIELDLDVAIAPGRRDLYSTIRLPRLERLQLREQPRTLQDLLHLVLVPGTTRLSLQPIGVNSGPDISDLLVPVRKHLRDSTALVPRSIIFSVPEHPPNEPVTHFTVHLNHKPESLGYRGVGALFSITSHPTTGPSLEQILVKVLETIPTKNITHLCIGDRYYTAFLSEGEWRAALPLLPAVRMCESPTGPRRIRVLRGAGRYAG
ncbi:hypothetical protein C8F01DRAFT_1027890 [Mycena amicta]|nr:hypothetical protein C8F01DRAFT_1027890 [Mycena amicta]